MIEEKIRILWASVTGVAAAVAIILVLRAMMISSQPEIIQVFQANHVAREVTLQVNDEKEIKPLKRSGRISFVFLYCTVVF